MYGRANISMMSSFRQDPSITRQKLKPGTVRRIVGYAKPYKLYLSLFLAATILDALITVVNPLLLAVIIAFAASNRAAARNERIQVTASEVRVLLQSAKGVKTVWSSPTAFTRVALVGQAGDEDDLRLQLSDRELRVARDLSRPERQVFAKALDRAIWRARTGQLQA